MQNTTKGHAARGLWGTVCGHRVWFLAFSGIALALRFYFVFRHRMITPDSLVYGDFAKNWLQAHVYGISDRDGPMPSDIRLPGYPAYLAFWFLIAGVDHYGAACIAQAFVDVGTCFLVAAMALRLADERAARWAFALTAACPFLANYAGAALTETLEIFFTALALLLAMRASEDRSLWPWALCGLAIGAATLLRPDGGILLIAVLLWMARRLIRPAEGSRARVLLGALVVCVAAAAPLVPWAIRNAITLHRLQPLAPATATEPDQFYPHGFERWQRTWIVDYASLEDVWFRVDGEELSLDLLPKRAFDNEEQRRRTQQLIAAYNENLALSPELDADFAELARERIHNAPLRYYVWLPILRGIDMWFRPRTEILPVEVHWWWFDDPEENAIALLLAAINFGFVAAAVWAVREWRAMPEVGLLVTFVIVRTVLITAIATPEQRYMLESFPVVLALAGTVASRQSRVARLNTGSFDSDLRPRSG